jgi:hypothetical protein
MVPTLRVRFPRHTRGPDTALRFKRSVSLGPLFKSGKAHGGRPTFLRHVGPLRGIFLFEQFPE